MIPTWVLSTLVILLGCIFACFIGSSLPDYDILGAYFVIAAIACTVCLITKNFALLLALGTWIPFAPPIPMFHSVPAVFIFSAVIAVMMFFRLCQKGSLNYARSFNWPFLILMSWVPIRFLMNPVTKLGASVTGGSGVSGALPYFNYILAAFLVIFVGFVIHSRELLVSYYRWCFKFALLFGLILMLCAVIPATAPILAAMGSFQAGEMSDGIQRLVQLPGYGLYICECALCPALFRLNRFQTLACLVVGGGMIILGGNRSAMVALFISVPVILFLRRQSNALIMTIAVGVMLVACLRFATSTMDEGHISPYMRSFGMLDSKIDDSTGGSASADWRYAVWTDALDKIMQNPLIGKGFGNLPQHLDPTDPAVAASTDFEVLLAGGEAHNGFITAAYAFGIPFMALMSIAIILFSVKEASAALLTNRHDAELRELHALFTALLVSYPILIYTGLDLSVDTIWIYAGSAIALKSILKKGEVAANISGTGTVNPQLYALQKSYAAK